MITRCSERLCWIYIKITILQIQLGTFLFAVLVVAIHEVSAVAVAVAE